MRLELHREGQDVGRGRQLQVQHGGDRRREPADVVVLDVAAILAQVHGNPVRAGLLAERCGRGRIGLVGATGLAQRRYVVDVHIEPDHSLASGFGSV